MKTGPLEVVASKTSRIPIYPEKHHGKDCFMVIHYAAGERKRARFHSLEEAREYAKSKIKDLTAGTAHVGTLTPRQVAVITDAVEVCRDIGLPISQVIREYAESFKLLGRQPLVMKACEHYAAYLEKQKNMHAPVKFTDVATEFLAQITGQGRSLRYLQDCRTRLTRASKAFQSYIQTITAPDIENWLNSIKAAGSTRNNYRATLIALFSFARNRGYLPRNERTEVELTIKAVDRGGDIGIYAPAQLSVMLAGIDSEWVPFIALGAFAGLRTAEIHRLEWQDIDLHGGHIVVGKHKAKTAQRRIVPILPALRAWLEPLVTIGIKSGFVVPHFSSDSKMLDSFRESFEHLKIRRVHNGLRHSFATYRLAITQSADQVSLEMGNSPKKLFQNYRELATKAQAEKWFGVMPVASEKVVSIAIA